MSLAVASMFFGIAYGASGDGVEVWIPEKMIVGEKYHGVIITESPARDGLLVLLSAEGGIDTPDSVSILPHRNHGIFGITPTGPGDAKAFAAAGGQLYEAQGRVFSPKGEPHALQIVLPANKTRADSMLGYVGVLDDNGAPVPVGEGLAVDLSTSRAIRAPDHIVIKSGTYHARFGMDVGGSGEIIASAGQLRPHHTGIEKVQGEFTVRVAVAPDIAMQDSYVFYYVWLEKNGAPFAPPHTVHAFLHSSDPNVGRLGASPHTEDPQDNLVYIVDGMARGILYTGDRGYATITASVEGFGTAQHILFVGPARFSGLGDDRTVTLSEQNLVGGDHTQYEPNTLLAWAYPSVTDGPAWGVVAMYNVERTKSLDMIVEPSGIMSGMVAENEVLSPVRADGSTIYVSSGSGLEHGGAYVMEEYLAKTNAIEFPLTGSSHGHYDVSVSGSGLGAAGAALDVVPGYEESFDISIVQIPATPHVKQDIAMVSILDETGAMVDARGVFGRDAGFVIRADMADVSDDIVRPAYSGSAIVRGSLYGAGQITAILDDVGYAGIDVSPAGTAASLEVLAPGRVHVGEDFPFVVHEVDSLGIPIRRAADLRVSSPLDVRMGTTHMVLGGPGTGQTSVISGIGAAVTEMAGFENQMEVDMHLEKTRFRVGENVTLDITSSADAKYAITTDFPFVQTGAGTFVIIPDHEMPESVVTILAQRDGYEPVSLSETIIVEELFLVEVVTVDSGGSRIYPTFEVGIGGDSVSAKSPYYAEARAGDIHVKFQESHAAGARGYSLDGILANGMEVHGSSMTVSIIQDTVITATYSTEILVDVSGGEGGGVYKYGDTVRVSAPDRDKVLFLVRDVFDHWEGLSAGSLSSETFIATENVSIEAVYREDYTYLMVAVAVPLLAASAYAVFRNATGFRWMAENMLEKLVHMAGKKPAKDPGAGG